VRTTDRRPVAGIGYARPIATYEVTLSDSPTGAPAGTDPWRRTVEASSRPEAVRIAEDLFRVETRREPLHVAVRALA
jgi:hypothetical protein